MNLTKNYFLSMVAVAALSLGLAASSAKAQTALFSYDDMGAGGGLPNSGTYHPGDSFTVQVSLAFAPGGSVANLDGLSYWFQQTSPNSAPFPFSITLRDTSVATGNLNDQTELQTPNLTYPQNLNPSNANDLGQAVPKADPADGAGTYIIADLTFSIAQNAPITGTFILSNTTTAGKTSVISDSSGHTFAIPEADYTITLVPEPATWTAACLVLAALIFTPRSRFSRSHQ